MLYRFFLALCKAQDHGDDSAFTGDLFPRSFIPTAPLTGEIEGPLEAIGSYGYSSEEREFDV